MQTKEKRPNVLWILGDQHRGQALSLMGDPNVSTPHIDLLAADGMCFTEARSGFPLCCPFRGSMLTGRYPHHCVPGHEYPLDPGQPTLAHVLGDHGYDTAYIGKWHLNGFHESQGRAAFHTVEPGRRGGFARWLGYDNNNSPWDSYVHGDMGDGEVRYRLPGYETDCLTDIMLEYLDQKAEESEKPFFAVLSVQPPHDPYEAPACDMARHHPAHIRQRPNVPDIPSVTEEARRELAGYYAQIENLDRNVGRIMEKLTDTGLLTHTHVIFFSDHGDMHGSHGLFRKTNPYEEAVRIPFIIGGAGRRYAPWRCGRTDAPLNHVDIAPTTLGLCGLPIPAWMEGTDYSSCRLDGRPEVKRPDSQFLQSVIPTGHGDSVELPWRGVVTVDGWKYVCLPGMPWLLFNLSEDPYEQVNHALNPRYRAIRDRLGQRLGQWIDETGDRFELPRTDREEDES